MVCNEGWFDDILFYSLSIYTFIGSTNTWSKKHCFHVVRKTYCSLVIVECKWQPDRLNVANIDLVVAKSMHVPNICPVPLKIKSKAHHKKNSSRHIRKLSTQWAFLQTIPVTKRLISPRQKFLLLLIYKILLNASRDSEVNEAILENGHCGAVGSHWGF